MILLLAAFYTGNAALLNGNDCKGRYLSITATVEYTTAESLRA